MKTFPKPPTIYRGVPIPDDIRQRWYTLGPWWRKGVDSAAAEFDVWIEPGQVWEDNDYRTKGRKFRIEKVDGETAICRLISDYTDLRGFRAKRHAASKPGTQFKLKRRRLYPNARGYRLVDGEQP